MIDLPPLSDILVVLSLPIAIVVTIVLALTGYGWGCLWFLIGIPAGSYFIGKVMDG